MVTSNDEARRETKPRSGIDNHRTIFGSPVGADVPCVKIRADLRSCGASVLARGATNGATARAFSELRDAEAQCGTARPVHDPAPRTGL
jgi:hypothetical protein